MPPPLLDKGLRLLCPSFHPSLHSIVLITEKAEHKRQLHTFMKKSGNGTYYGLFFSFFSVRVSPFFTSSRIIIFNKENIINFFIRKKRLFWSFAFQCFVQLRTTILRSALPIFVKVAHIFSRFCLLDTGNINLHQSTAEK